MRSGSWRNNQPAQSGQVKNTISEINQFIRDVVEGTNLSSHSFEDIRSDIDRMNPYHQ